MRNEVISAHGGVMTAALALAWLLVAMSGAHGAAPEGAAHGDETEATSVVRAYLGALERGDIAATGAWLGGDFEGEAAQRLADPDYRASLEQRYLGARFEVLQARTLKEGQVQVDAHIHLRSGEDVGVRFTLERSPGDEALRIHGERDISASAGW